VAAALGQQAGQAVRALARRVAISNSEPVSNGGA
jgi:hypothetical protein